MLHWDDVLLGGGVHNLGKGTIKDLLGPCAGFCFTVGDMGSYGLGIWVEEGTGFGVSRLLDCWFGL